MLSTVAPAHLFDSAISALASMARGLARMHTAMKHFPTSITARYTLHLRFIEPSIHLFARCTQQFQAPCRLCEL